VANSDNLEVNGGDVTSFIRLGDANLDSNAVASSGLQHVDVIGDIISLFAHVDGVLACDHAIAHLGGLWGINTALMLPSFCDGRWGLQSTTSIFPSVRLFHKSNQVDRCHQQC